MADHALLPVERIERAILVLRGHKVMLDAELAHLYGVETRVLVQAVKRNLDHFPADFMFQLTIEEADFLESQSVILKTARPRGRPGFKITIWHLESEARTSNTCPTPSPSRAWPCCRACCAAPAPCR